VVLIHGAGSSHLVWPPLMRRLAGCAILALDLPGHGRSGGPGCRSVAAYAARVLDFLAEKRAFQVALVGHSLGGAVALHLALEHPHLVYGLGLISSGARLGLPPALRQALEAPHALPDALRALARLAFSPHTPATLRDQLLQPLRRASPTVLLGDWQSAADFDVRARMLPLDMPAWVATGADDRLTPPSSASFLAAFLPRAALQLVPRAGHFLPLEQPAALSAGFSDFISRLKA
jgi:pimeloyl-ACP methyl ester carboxylesterase